MRYRALVAALGLAGCAAAAAQGFNARITTGVPQASLVDSHAVPWRFVTARASWSGVSLEARLPECIDALRPPVPPSGLTPRPACSGAAGVPAPLALEQQWSARWRLPRWVDGGPSVELSWRRWATPASRTNRGSREERAQLELGQWLGPLHGEVGYVTPLGATRTSDPWTTRYVGVSGSPARGLWAELTYDFARRMQASDIDRQVTARLSYTATRAWRWSVFAVRQVDDAPRRWDAGLGIEGTF